MRWVRAAKTLAADNRHGRFLLAFCAVAGVIFALADSSDPPLFEGHEQTLARTQDESEARPTRCPVTYVNPRESLSPSGPSR